MSALNFARWPSVIISQAMRPMASVLSSSAPAMACSSPCTRTIGGRPTLRWMSEAPRRTAALQMSLMSKATLPSRTCRRAPLRRRARA